MSVAKSWLEDTQGARRPETASVNTVEASTGGTSGSEGEAGVESTLTEAE